MLNIKEIRHPLRKIKLLIEDSIPASDIEDKLQENYLKLHDLVFNFEKERQDLEELFSSHRIFKLEILRRFDGIEPRMDRLIASSQKLLQKQITYKIFRKGFDTFINDAEEYNEDYNKFYARFEEMTKDKEMLLLFREKIEETEAKVEKALNDHLTMVDELFKLQEQCAMDWTSYYMDKGSFMKIWDMAAEHLGQLLKEINLYTAEEYNPFILRFNEAIERFRVVNETIVSLRNKYLEYTKAKEIESIVLRLDWDEHKAIPTEVENVDYGISYDMEKAKNGDIILHLDMELVIENLLHLWMRGSFRMKCKKDEIFTQEMLEPLVGHCMEEMKNEIILENAARSRQIDMRNISTRYDVVENVTKGYLGVITQGEGVWNEAAEMYAPALHITSPGMFRLLGVTVVNVMDQLLFANNAFNCLRNRRALNNIVSLSQFTTLKMLLPKMEKGEITLNNRQYLLFLSLIDCVSQMLLSDRGDDLLAGLERVKMTADLRMEFLKHAQAHYKEALENFRKHNITITFLEETRDWNRVFY